VIRIPLGVFVGLLVLLNLAAFAAQGIDKSRAKADRRRIPERTLLALGVPLAALGMLYGMTRFRHKTQKREFQTGAALVVAANLVEAGVISWLAANGHVTFNVVLY